MSERAHSPAARIADLASLGALLGAGAGLLASFQDIASTIGWLSNHADRLRLLAALIGTGAGAGALVGAALAPLLAPARPTTTHLAARLAFVCAGPLAIVANLLFTGGRMRRLPALWALRPVVWVILVLGTATALTLGARVVLALRAARSARARLAGVALFVALAQVLHGLDHRFLPRLYEYLHACIGALTALMWAAALALAVPRAPRRMRTLGAATAMAGALGIAAVWSALERWENVRAEVFGVHAPFVRHLAVAIESARVCASPTRRDALATRRSRYVRERALTTGDDPSLPHVPGAHVLLITVDAMRADRLGRVIAGRSLTPTLDALAARGVLFERAYTQAPHSSYAITSLHTSEYLHETVPLGQRQPLTTLADALAAHGYRTAALYTNGIFFTEGERLVVYRERDLGFRRADHVDRRASAQAEAAMREIDEIVRLGEPPTLLWVHFFDTHEPYGGQGPGSLERYDDAVRSVDAQIGRLLEYASRRLARDVVVALAADHGEEFGEHGGVYHGSTLYEEQVRVPLLIAAPGMGPARVHEPVELIDLAPTLLALAGAPRPASMRGRDLRALAAGRAQGTTVFGAVNTRTMAVRWPYKLVTDLRYGVNELYDLSRDPAEHANLAGSDHTRVEELQGEIAAWIDALSRTAASPPAIARGRMGDRRVIDELLAIARDRGARDATRLEAIDVLAGFGDRALAANLLPLLSDESREVADRAAAAIGSSGDDRALARLRDALTRDEPDIRQRAAFALARLGDLGAVPSLIELLYCPDEQTRLAAIDALGDLRAQEATEALLEALPDDHVRYRVVLALGRIGHPGTLQTLADLALSDRADDTRANAAAALALAGGRASVSLLTRLLRDDPAQQFAASALGHAGAVGHEVPGWDARASSGEGWTQCGPAGGGAPAWQYLDAWQCSSPGTARIRVRVRDGQRPWLMVLRARCGSTLVVFASGRDIARLPASERLREWRVLVEPGTFASGENDVTIMCEGGFALGHLVLVER